MEELSRTTIRNPREVSLGVGLEGSRHERKHELFTANGAGVIIATRTKRGGGGSGIQ